MAAAQRKLCKALPFPNWQRGARARQPLTCRFFLSQTGKDHVPFAGVYFPIQLSSSQKRVWAAVGSSESRLEEPVDGDALHKGNIPLQMAWSCDPPPPYMTMGEYQRSLDATVDRWHGQLPAGPVWHPTGNGVAPDQRSQLSSGLEWHPIAQGVAPVQRSRARKTERYAVRRPMVNDMLMRLAGRGGQALKPTVDAFGDQELHVCDKWWGPGSEVPDSFKVNWAAEPLLWLNPPFSLMSRVIQKIKEDQATCVLVCPHWTTEPWFQDVMKMSKRSYFYKKGTQLFEVMDGIVPGIRWPVWVLLIDGSDLSQAPDERPWKITRAASRRWRRRYKAIPLC